MLLAVSLGQIFLSEFMGTAMLILLGAGVCMNVSFNKSKGQGGGWLLINFGWGLAVFSGVLVAFQTGGHLNPAVTLGIAASKVGTENPCFRGTGAECDIPITASVIGFYILAQMAGAFLGAALAWLVYKKQFDIEQPEGSKLGVFSTGPASRSYGWNLVTEIIATFVLVFVVLISGYAAGAGSGVANMGWLNALGVAFLIVAIGASLGGPTGYAINPARDLGPRLWHAVMPTKGKGDSDWSYSWVPILGPILGGVLAGLAYLAVSGVAWTVS
ncbi:MAG: aquaporin family protein [Propionibacteriaceae bacterium]|jgi:glycerol uptake facilitator protein|nr:aquaporin family protein [Propionibacteriaceae bacterium]